MGARAQGGGFLGLRPVVGLAPVGRILRAHDRHRGDLAHVVGQGEPASGAPLDDERRDRAGVPPGREPQAARVGLPVESGLGRELVATEMCIADEIASAAELVMGKDKGVPVAVVRGTDPAWARSSSVAAEIIRPPAEDLFR